MWLFGTENNCVNEKYLVKNIPNYLDVTGFWDETNCVAFVCDPSEELRGRSLDPGGLASDPRPRYRGT